MRQLQEENQRNCQFSCYPSGESHPGGLAAFIAAGGHAELFHEVSGPKRQERERYVWYVIQQYAEHYSRERSHQGTDNEIPDPPSDAPPGDGPIACRERLGGLLKYYYREAA